MDAMPEDASEPEAVEATAEAEAASTEPKVVHTVSGDLLASNASIAGEVRVSQAAVLALVSEAPGHTATARTGLFVNPELDRVEISHGDVVFVIIFEAAYRALKGLYEILTALLK